MPCRSPDEWKTEPGFVQYLSQLSAYSVEKLRKLLQVGIELLFMKTPALSTLLELEPERLAEERKCVLGSTQRLAFNNYQTFIETAECSRAIFTDVRSEERGRVTVEREGGKG